MNYLKYVYDTQKVFTRVFGRRIINLWHDKSLNKELQREILDNEATNTQAEKYDRSLKSSQRFKTYQVEMYKEIKYKLLGLAQEVF